MTNSLETQPSPQDAWKLIREGNRRFTHGEVSHPHQDQSRRDLLTAGQRPHAVVLSCSDSRVPVEIVLDQGLGDVFVIRTAGEVTDISILASLEFAVNTLEVPLILVLGHEGCGAIAAAQTALDTAELPDGFQRVFVEKVIPSILSARNEGRDETQEFEREHVKQITNHIVDRSPEIQQKIQSGECAVVGARYRLEDGLAEPLISYGIDKAEL